MPAKKFVACCLGLVLLTPVPGRPAEPDLPLTGIASVYAARFEGRKTASGEPFDGSALTAAHRKLPFGTRVRVKNLKNGRSVVVRINDRGPFIAGRIIDVSPAAARKLDFLRAGLARVNLEILPEIPEEKVPPCLI